MNLNSGLASSAYRRAATAVHPTVAVVRLYDEAILAITQAIRAFEAKAHETAYARVVRTAAILRGLDHALDHEVGGEVAERLHRVYGSYIMALHLNYGKPDVVARYEKLLVGLGELRDAWASIAGSKPRAEIAAGSGERPVDDRLPGQRQLLLGRDEIDLMQLALACRRPPGAPAPAPAPARPAPARAARPTPTPKPAITRAPPRRPDGTPR